MRQAPCPAAVGQGELRFARAHGAACVIAEGQWLLQPAMRAVQPGCSCSRRKGCGQRGGARGSLRRGPGHGL